MSYRMIRTGIACAGVFILGIAVAVSLRKTGRVFAQNGRTPFTAVKLIRVHDPAGILQEQDTVTIAVRSNGSYARKSIKILPNKPKGSKELVMREIRDTSSQQQISLETSTNSKQTFPINAQRLQSMTRPTDPACAANLPSDTSVDRSPQPASILGYPLVKLTSISSRGMGQITVERWVAPALNCEDLKDVTTAVIASKSLKAVTTVETLSIAPGEPDLTLFEVPADAVERSPSEMLLEYAKKNNDVCTMCENGSAAIFDKNYFERRTRQ